MPEAGDHVSSLFHDILHPLSVYMPCAQRGPESQKKEIYQGWECADQKILFTRLNIFWSLAHAYDFSSIVLELQLIKVFVRAIYGNQSLVGTFLDNRPALENDNAICIHD